MAKVVAQSSIVFEVLEKDNYVDWSEAIEAYLKAQDLWDVVKSDQEPPKIEEDEAQFKAWEKKNAEALHVIKISCGRHFISHIRGIREANKAWRKLNLQANFIPPFPRRMECTITPQQVDVENVDDEYNEAYKSLADAFSRRDIADAIKLCKENPALLKERLHNYTPLLHQLIVLVHDDSSAEDQVVEMLQSYNFPNEAFHMRDSLGRTPLIAAVSRVTIGIARCLVEKNDTLLSPRDGDHSGLIPLAVAIDSLYPEMIKMLNSRTPPDFWTMKHGRYGATVINKCFQARQLDFATQFIKEHPDLIFAKDVNGISPLSAAAREPYMLSTGRYHKFPKFISNFLRVCLPKHSMGENSRIELLIAMRNAIRDLNMATGLLRDAFFEAIKCDNFNFLIMLINADEKILEEKNDMSKNIYMCAIEYRRARVFSLIFWDKNDSIDRKQYINVWQDKWKNNLLHIAATWTPTGALDGISKPTTLMIKEEMWFEKVSNLAPASSSKQSNVDGKTPYELFDESHKDLMMEAEKWMKESAASWAIVGPLIITIMFAAAFQIPGGYNQETGFPIFFNKMLFKLYLVVLSISFFSATFSVWKFLEILASNYQGKDFRSSLMNYNVITGTLFMSLATMLAAFCLGLFLTVHVGLASFLPIATFATLLVGYIVYTRFPLLVATWKNSLFEEHIGDEVELIFQKLNRKPDRRPTEEVAT